MNNSDWPFFILRCHGTADDNIDFIQSVRDYQVTHGHLVDEIWFCGDNVLASKELAKKGIEKCKAGLKLCEESGIAFAYQQGITLNHGPDGVKRDWVPEDAWAVDADGNRLYGLFCATSTFAKDWNRWYTSEVLRELHPVSYWPDDDCRLSCKANVCFCDRCLARFNEAFHHSYSREQLKELIFGDVPRLDIRKEWVEFNRQVLGEFAKVYREAVEQTGIPCRLGIQTVYSYVTYDGKDYKPLLEGLSGPANEKVGIRPGAGYYSDHAPEYLFAKILGVASEASRCSKLGFIGQICYEAENYPHIGAEKTPESILKECSFALSSGCDSLAVYWGADGNAESHELYDFFFETAARFMPFLKQIRDTRQNTELAGLALYRGSRFLQDKQWYVLFDEQVCTYFRNAFPVSVPEAQPDGWILDEQGVNSLDTEDYSECFSKTVLMTADDFIKLKEKHSSLKFTSKIRLEKSNALGDIVSGGLSENFDGKRAKDCSCAIFPMSQEVIPLSSITGLPEAAGTVIVPTEFGGHAIIVQHIMPYRPWTGYRRQAILDAIDKTVSGGLSARLLTPAMAIAIQAYRRKDGKTTGVYLLNSSIGSSMPLTLAIRRPAMKEVKYMLPGQVPVTADVLSSTNNEIIVSLPKLDAWQPMLIY